MIQLVYEIALVFLPVWVVIAVIVHEKTACHAAPHGDKMCGTGEAKDGATSPETVQTVHFGGKMMDKTTLVRWRNNDTGRLMCDTSRTLGDLRQMDDDKAELMALEAETVLRDLTLSTAFDRLPAEDQATVHAIRQELRKVRDSLNKLEPLPPNDSPEGAD